MARIDATAMSANEFFRRHIQYEATCEDFGSLDDLLPKDPHFLCALLARCLLEARRAYGAGRHLEGRRIDILSQQLSRRVYAESTR